MKANGILFLGLTVANALNIPQPARQDNALQDDAEIKPTTTIDPIITPEAQIKREEDIGWAAQVAVGTVPTICKDDKFQWKTKLSVPTGNIHIRQSGTGWGPKGSIWNISVSDGAKLTKMEADCQGSTCDREDNKGNDGEMKERKDGSYYMNVTDNMFAAIFGVITTSNEKRSDQPINLHDADVLDSRGEKKYTLTISGTPPCGLEIAENCTNRDFHVNMKQWEAYSVDKLIPDFVKENKIQSLDEFRSQAIKKYQPGMDADNQRCDISLGSDFNCETPSSDQCSSAPDEDTTKGLIMTTGIIRYTNVIHSVREALVEVRGSFNDYIPKLVNSFVVFPEKNPWTSLNKANMAVNVFTALCTFAGIGAGPAVAGVMAACGGAGVIISQTLTGTERKLFPGTEQELRFQETADQQEVASNTVAKMASMFEQFYTEKNYDGEKITKLMGEGIYTDTDVTNLFNKQGFHDSIIKYYERAMIGQWITKALTDQHYYIVFVPYQKDMKYYGKDGFEFTEEICQKRFHGNPSWKFEASCTLELNGKEGMTLIARPFSKGLQSKGDFTKSVFNHRGENVTAFTIMASSMDSHDKHGFDFSLADANFTEYINPSGPSKLETFFGTDSFKDPGVFHLPVCEISDLVYVPEIDQVMSDWHNVGMLPLWRASDPCQCKSYKYKSKDGKKEQAFVDKVSKEIKKSVTENCDVLGQKWP